MKLYRDHHGNLVDEEYAREHPDTTTVDDHPMAALTRTIHRIDNDTLSLRAELAVVKATHDSDMRMLRARISKMESKP